MRLTEPKTHALTDEQHAAYEKDGYLILRGFFDGERVSTIRNFFDTLAAEGKPVPGHWEPETGPETNGNPLKRYPRVMMPHRFHSITRDVLLDQRLREVLSALFGEEPIATQSMFYYKPPGALGQALHQDNFYLRVKPGTCVAAWIAIDRTRPENGGLYVVPGTHKMSVICPEKADASKSFTTELVRLPPGTKAVPVNMEPGDVLFFNGNVIHGSPPNRSKTTWRKSLINHYIPFSSTHVSKYYHPLLDFSGNTVQREFVHNGGPCGTEAPVGSYGKWH